MKSERSKGAQPGHRGTTLTRKDIEERIAARKLQHEIVDHGQGPGKAIVKYVLDICITSYATKHRFYPDSRNKAVCRGLLFSPAELRGHNLAKRASKTKRSFPAHVE